MKVCRTAKTNGSSKKKNVNTRKQIDASRLFGQALVSSLLHTDMYRAARRYELWELCHSSATITLWIAFPIHAAEASVVASLGVN